MIPLVVATALLVVLSQALPPWGAFVSSPMTGYSSKAAGSQRGAKGGRGASVRRLAPRAPLFTVAETSRDRRGSRVSTALGSAARQVTTEELEMEMTEWDQPLILDVFATWCGPCLQMKPEIEKVAQALAGRCRVLKMDSDEEEAMATTLNIYGLPTLLYIKDGEIAHRTEGSMPAEEILQLADIHLFGVPPPEDPADGLFIDTSACQPPESPAAPSSPACSPPSARAREP